MGNKQMLKQKGITLVSLVITIVILLILAGISIAQLTGNGLFKNAKLAKEKSENAQKLENSILEEYESELSKYITGTRLNLESKIIYPEGTEENPPTISKNQRIIIENPYPGHTLYLIAQIQIEGLWCETGFIYNGAGGMGVKPTQLQGEGVDKIIIQSGSVSLKAYSNNSGDGFGKNINADSAPYRLKVICLD